MDKFFIIQLITSFIVGGVIISIISFLAEKVNKKIAGIILAFPTTMALGFFFLGWTLSPEIVAKIIPATLIPLGLSILFTVIYAYTARYSQKIIKNKILQIIFSFIISIGTWFALAIPVTILKLNSLLFGIAGYILLILVTYLLLQGQSKEKPIILKNYTFSQKISRAFFLGFIIFLTTLLGKILNPFWGGMLAVFPVLFSSLLIILHWYYGPKNLFPTIQAIPIGSLSLFAYAITAMLVFPLYGFIIGTLFAYIISIIVSLLLIKFKLNS